MKSVICWKMPRDEAAEKCPDARRVAPIRGSVWCLLPDSSLCQNGKQVEIITKMIFELCYIEAIITNTNWFSIKALQRSR